MADNDAIATYYHPKTPEYLRAAYQCGAEAYTNEKRAHCGMEDRRNIAEYHPSGTWRNMPKEDQDAALHAWQTAVERVRSQANRRENDE